MVDAVEFDVDAPAVGEQDEEIHPLAGQRHAGAPRVRVVVQVDLRYGAGVSNPRVPYRAQYRVKMNASAAFSGM